MMANSLVKLSLFGSRGAALYVDAGEPSSGARMPRRFILPPEIDRMGTPTSAAIWLEVRPVPTQLLSCATRYVPGCRGAGPFQSGLFECEAVFGFGSAAVPRSRSRDETAYAR